MVVVAIVVFWLFFAVAMTLIEKDHTQLGATVLALAVAAAAISLTIGRRMTEVDREMYQTRRHAEIIRLLESIDRRLAALSPSEPADSD
jgi:hypothetical protein